ncbi:unnamed protein product [Rotaria sp. Silwood2]|nr:unnamed protein product [Rotaria sp. Silwood2]
MKYLGHIVTQDGIKPDPTLTKAVTDFPQPKTIKDVQSFLGLTGYYRRFIEDYSKVAEPLIKQLRQLKERNYHLNWNPECTTAFETLKSKLVNAPIMKTPNFNEPFILELDACEYGLGAVLAQEYDKKKFVIAYASRTLSPTERNYSATEREALAIVWATQHFRPYLEGTKVLIRSDCKALQWLKNAKDVSGRWARWAMKLSALQIESIQYRPGAANANADSLSRNPVTTCIMESIGQINPKDNESEERMIRANTNTSNSLNSYEISTIETIINLWENTNILEDIKKEQQADSKLIPIIQQLKTMTPDLVNDKRQPFVLINDILYKIKNSSRHYNQRALGNKHLLVIQKVMQHKLLQWAHEHPTAGHAGQQKTLFRLSTRVYWTSMRKDIYNFVAACQECQRFKLGDNVNLGAINADRLKVYFEPLQTTSLDNTNNSGSQSDSVIRADAQLDIADDAGTQTDNASEDDAQPDITDDAATQTDNASEEDAQSDIAMPQPTNLETSMETDIINEDSDAATSNIYNYLEETKPMLFMITIFHALFMMGGIRKMQVSGLINFTIPKTDIVHTKSGLILHYLSEYRPADKIVTFTVTIPMVPDMCYLIPQRAKRKIPHCQSDSPHMQNHGKQSITSEANKSITDKRTTKVFIMPSMSSTTRDTTLFVTPRI